MKIADRTETNTDQAAAGKTDDTSPKQQAAPGDTFDGGAGWTDTIRLSDVTGGPGGGWTLTLDGGELSLEGVDKIDW